MGLIRYMKRQASLYVQFIKQGILGTGKDHHSLHLSEVLLSIVQVWLRCSYSIMADGVRFILDKLASLFRRLEDTELFSHVRTCTVDFNRRQPLTIHLFNNRTKLEPL